MLGKSRAPRLSTAERREQILDSGVRLILGQGIARCTLETIACEAGISKALIYRHFSSREELFKAVIDREYQILRERSLGSPKDAQTFEGVLRISHPKVFNYLHERGPIIRAMFNDRSVAEALREHENQQRAAMHEFYIRKIIQTYAVPKEIALLGTLMTVNAAVGSARALRSYGYDPKDAAEFWTTFILGGWASISAGNGWKEDEPDAG